MPVDPFLAACNVHAARWSRRRGPRTSSKVFTRGSPCEKAHGTSFFDFSALDALDETEPRSLHQVGVSEGTDTHELSHTNSSRDKSSWARERHDVAQVPTRRKGALSSHVTATPNDPSNCPAPYTSQVTAVQHQEVRGSESRLAKVSWINLDRRKDRAQQQEKALRCAGLSFFGERVAAVDGRSINLSCVSPDILTEDGREQAQHPPDFVLGRVLTPGAVGLWLTWHHLLVHMSDEARACDCFLVVEDDAEYCEDFVAKLRNLLETLDAVDPEWHACAVGYIRSKSRVLPLSEVGGEDVEAVGWPGKLCGASGILVHIRGARPMLEELFPVGPDSQFDLWLTMVANGFHGREPRLHFFAAASPLVAAPLSEAGDTDIQRIPAAKRQALQEEAAVRHKFGDAANADASRAHLLGSGTFADVGANGSSMSSRLEGRRV